MINLKINDIDVAIEKGSTILEAAKKINIKIPTLCHLDLGDLGFVNKDANCRICLVEDKWGTLKPACNTLVKEGMEIRTDTINVVNSRRYNLELLLSNHPNDCLTCNANGKCELQKLSIEFNINEISYPGERIEFEIDDSSNSIIRDPNKCILCKRCETMCTDFQTVGTLTDVGRGFSTVVGTQYQEPMQETNCTFCGQCLSVCPTGALTEVSNVEDVYKDLANPDKVVVVQVAPAVRVALGEEFDLDVGEIVTGKLVTALRNIGFDYVFDTNFAADLTTMEEANEFVQRLENDQLPMITSCCPSWVKFIEHNFPDLLDIPSTCKSPHEMFGSIAKSYFAEKNNIDPKDLVVVSVMPCVAKKYESARSELGRDNEISDVDWVVTTRELASMINEFSINFEGLEDGEYDDSLGESTGAGAIYGASGGVAESVIRTAYKIVTGEDVDQLVYEDLHGFDGLKFTEVDIDGTKVKIAAASGLKNARRLLEEIESGQSYYDIIEIMACPGGCINGGGQPFIHGDSSIVESRMNSIRQVDENKEIRRAHENESIQKLYKDYLGQPGGERAHELLHTSFTKRPTII